MKSKLLITRQYVRDGRAPVPVKALTSRIMSSIKGKNTKPEMTLRKELWSIGVRAYRLHSKKVIGKPDISFLPKKIAIFVNGCFWHRCPHCQLSLPRVHSKFWKEKFQKNVVRDRKNIEALEAMKWKVFTIWECQIAKNVTYFASEIRKAVNSGSSN